MLVDGARPHLGLFPRSLHIFLTNVQRWRNGNISLNGVLEMCVLDLFMSWHCQVTEMISLTHLDLDKVIRTRISHISGQPSTPRWQIMCLLELKLLLASLKNRTTSFELLKFYYKFSHWELNPKCLLFFRTLFQCNCQPCAYIRGTDSIEVVKS